MIGNRYLLDHLITTAKDRIEKRTFEVYVAECLRLTLKNTASKEKSYITAKYADILDGMEKKPKTQEEDEETAKEIVDRIKAKLDGIRNGGGADD